MRRVALAFAVLLAASVAHAEPSSGVDVALFRSSYDANGLFALEGARLLPSHDLSFKLLVGYARSPIDVAVPGIGGTGKDSILRYLVTTDMAFGMSLSDRIAIGLDVAAYRTATAAGYGQRARYSAGGMVIGRSSGLIALRPLSNIDPSANPNDPTSYLGDELAGPLDARLGVKVALLRQERFAVAAIGSMFLPFGDEQMLLGDRNLVFEPAVAGEWRPSRYKQTRVLANLAARIRQRAVLEGYDTTDPAATASDAKAFLDVGSEIVLGVGGELELSPRATLAAEAQLFGPLPASIGYGRCHLYSGLPCSDATYWPGAKRGDLTALITVGASVHVTPDVTASLMAGTGQLGARGDDFRITTGLMWAPQPENAVHRGGHDKDGDGVPDTADACPDEPEDKDGYQDEDGCPDPDNDKDGVPDAADKCPNDPEDKDGFEDEDGCPDLDNDGDGIPDAKDKCPNDPETVNGFEDEDGCPDARVTSGPEERGDRIDLKGQPITFGRDGKPTAASKQVLDQVAVIVRARKLTIRVEVHLPLGTKSTSASAVAAQKKKDKAAAQRRAVVVVEALVAAGVPQAQLQAVGVGSDRPVGNSNPSDPINDRIDFIKAVP